MSDDSSTILDVHDPVELRRIIDSMPDDPSKTQHLLNAADKFRLRFSEGGDVRDVDQAIAFCRLAVKLSEDAPGELTRALRTLASASVARFTHLGDSADLADIEQATACHRRSLKFTAEDDPQLPQHIWEYTRCCMLHRPTLDDARTLREASTWLRAAEFSPHTSQDKPRLLATLGGLLTTCFVDHDGDVDDIHEAIVNLVRAIELTPYCDLRSPDYFGLLTTALRYRFDMRDPHDWALARYDAAVDVLPQDDRHKQSFLNRLARSFRARFSYNYEQDNYEQAIIDIDRAIVLQCRALEQPMHDRVPDADTCTSTVEMPPLFIPSRSDCLDFLASALRLRFACPDKVAAPSFSRHTSTVHLIPEEHPQKSLLLTRLAELFRRRFQSEKSPDDFIGSVTAARHALRLTPNSVPALRCLGHVLVARHIIDKIWRATADLDEAITVLQRAVEILAASNELDKFVIFALSNALSERFELLGDSSVSDIERAIGLLESSVAQLSDSHQDKPSYLLGLAHVLRARYMRYRKVRDVEEAIRVMEKARDLLPRSTPPTSRAGFLVALAELFKDRFEHLRHHDDLNSAVETYREAVTCSNFDPERVGAFVFLLQYQASCSPVGSAAGFDEAVDMMRATIRRNPLHPDMAGLLATLGNSLAMRFQHRGRPDDLNDAVEASERARALSAGRGDKWQVGDHLSSLSLAMCYLGRFRITHQTSDLDRVISLLHGVLDDGLPSSRVTTDKLNALVGYLILRLRKHPSPEADYLRDARDQAQRAVAASGGPSTVLEAALQFTSLIEWKDLLPEDEGRRLLEDVTEKYKQIILLIPQVAWLGDDIERRFELLSGYSARNIVGAAVAHALETNNVTSALEWFEQGRAVVWTQILGLRTPVDKLREKFPALADRLIRTSQALENAGRRTAPFHGPSSSQGDSSGTRAVQSAPQTDDILRATLRDVGSAMFERTRPLNEVDEHRRLAEEYRELLEDIRLRPGFQNFLLPRSKEELSLAAVDGPVACINIHSSRCDALILFGSEIHHVSLPELTPEVAQRWQRSLYDCLGLEFTRERKSKSVRTASKDGLDLLRVLRRMWVVVVQPIFAVLGWTDASLVKERRIRWCTRGFMAFLPLHAAGPYDGQSFNAFDIAISSYTPTLAALLPEARRSESTARPSILVVAQENAAGGSRLPGTKKECKFIRHLCQEQEISSQFLEDAEGTATAVLDNMTAHPYIHLACHGRQGVTDPMTSAFLLHDRELTLHELMAKSSRSGELAFLSACETSKGHGKIPDEVVHLAAGMLATGYRGVIGTMWPIHDSAAPIVANEFYKVLLKSRTEDGRPDIAYALHTAMRVLRDELLTEKALKENVSKAQDDDNTLAVWVPFVHFGL